MPVNRYEEAGRNRKAATLLGHLRHHGHSSADISTWDSGQWEKIAQEAGTRPPSEETRSQVLASVQRLEEREARNPDPFAGL